MNDTKNYEMNKWKHCIAKTRPKHCFYPTTNLCCFNCERNVECTEIAWKLNEKVLPCILDMTVNDINNQKLHFTLFDEIDRCEWSI